MKRRLLILPILAGFVLSGCSIQDLMFWKKKSDDTQQKEEKNEQDGDNQQSGSVTSVSVTASKTILAPGETLQLSVNVVVSNASKSVTWSSSNQNIATVSSTGLVTAKDVEGQVTITATSTVDSTKFGSVTLTVADQGFDPTWLDEGFTYSKTFPTTLIAAFLDVNENTIPVPATTGGFYYLQEAATATTAACFVVLADGTVAEAYQDAMIDLGSQKYYESSQGAYDAVSADLKFTVSAYEEEDDEYEPCSPTYICFYRSADVWEDDTPSTDTAWDENKFEEYTAEDYADETKAILANVPFLPIGANYEITYNDMSLYRAFGYDVPDYVTIGDYSLSNEVVQGYGAVLEAAGYTYDASEYVYYKTIGYKEYVVYIDFTEAGNTYFIFPYLAELDEFPSAGVNDFIANTIGSVKTLPAYNKTANATYTFDSGVDIDYDTYEEYAYAEVMVYDVKFSEAEAYVNDCKSLGYSATFHEETEDEYPSWEMTWGKICVNLIFVQAYDEDTDTYSQTDGDLRMIITGDQNVFEVPGLYLAKDSGKVGLNKTFQLEVVAFELGENPEISYVSANPAIATVSSAGLITGVAVGETTITASTTYNAENYEVVYTVNVVDEIIDTITLAKLGLSDIGTTYTSFSNKTDQSSAVYAGKCAGDGGAIQIRSKNSDSGIYSSTSGGTIRSVSFEFNALDTQSSAVKIVASNTAFSSTSDLFSATVVAEVTNSGGTASYTFEQNYAYVGIISGGGAHYINSIEFVWAA